MPAEEQNESRNPVASFFGELKRRRVLQLGGAYVAGAWLGAEIVSFLLEQFLAPAWTYRFVAIVFVVGFPLTMVLAWIVQVKEDGSWAIDPQRGDHRTLAAAIALGVVATAGLSWLIVPERGPEAVYDPMSDSLALMPFVGAEDLYRPLLAGLERSRDLTLVRLDPGETPGDLYDFGRSLRVAFLAIGDTGVQLLDIANESVVWAQSSQDDPQAIANGLLAAMSLPTLSRQEFMGTSNAAAYDAYLSGKRHATARTGVALRTAIDEFQQAIDVDSGYVSAYVGVAEAIYDLLAIDTFDAATRADLRDRAEASANMAQRLDRESASAISLLGLTTTNRQLRIQAFERAIELDPDHHPSFYRYALQMKEDGRLDEAENLLRRALLFYPTNERYRVELARILDLRDGNPSPR